MSHLHRHSPALHGRKAEAHVAVAAIGGGLGGVRLRQICPHGSRLLWLPIKKKEKTKSSLA